MTVEELKAVFYERMHEEIKDVIEDGKLYDKLLESGMDREAEAINSIACDEYRHAETYFRALKHHGWVPDAKTEDAFYTARHAFDNAEDI